MNGTVWDIYTTAELRDMAESSYGDLAGDVDREIMRREQH